MNIHDLYHPFLRYFRTKRMQQFCHLFGLAETTRVLDVGGDLFNWYLAPVFPKLTIVNLYFPRKYDARVAWVIADGRHLPFKDGVFDIAYSNSVIEHVGSCTDQKVFAEEVCRIASHCYVQTPNKRFPFEPHLLTPFIHWLPKSIRKYLLRNFTVWGLVTRPSKEDCQRFLDEVRLLDYKQMRALFPNACILKERALGVAKSLMAVIK